MRPQLTTEQFTLKAKSVHGDLYDYSKVADTYTTPKVSIICNKHGEFSQRPSSHLSGCGCPKCAWQSSALRRKSLTNDFTEKAILIHKNKYDYTKVEYVGALDCVIIICKSHGDFRQRPNDHLKGQGCKKCGCKLMGINSRLSTNKFTKKAKFIHGNKYDYTESSYITATTKVIIICPRHGKFSQTPHNHTANRTECPSCSGSKQENDWLDNLNIKELKRQHRIYFNDDTYFKADGYNPKTNTVYEFWGDYWHGNPAVFNPVDVNPSINKTYKQLYENTINKKQKYLDNGYNIVDIWENDYNRKIND